MRASRTCWGVVCLSIVCVAMPAAAQTPFQWRGRLAPGQSIEIKGINGDIRATGSSSADVEVIASRSARRSNPDDVRIEVVPHAGGVTVCAVYRAPPGSEPNACEPGSGGRSNSRNSDTTVQFDVRVPEGVVFIGRTVNGEVSGESLRGDADAATVNGSIRLVTTGRALASTVNGSVNATMGRADWPNRASFKTVNGGITLTLPGTVNADVRAQMMTGSLTSDFPVNVISSSPSGEGPQRLVGTIGGGGRELDLSTVNGSIRLLRGQ